MTREELEKIKANYRMFSRVSCSETETLIEALEQAWACIERVGSPVWPEDDWEYAQKWVDANLRAAGERTGGAADCIENGVR